MLLKTVSRTLQDFKLKSALPNRFLYVHQSGQKHIFLLTVHMMDFFIYGFIDQGVTNWNKLAFIYTGN